MNKKVFPWNHSEIIRITERLWHILRWLNFQDADTVWCAAESSYSKCSTLTICCVGEGLKSPRGQTEVLVEVKEKEKLNWQEGRVAASWYEASSAQKISIDLIHQNCRCSPSPYQRLICIMKCKIQEVAMRAATRLNPPGCFNAGGQGSAWSATECWSWSTGVM